jgi:precorrin-2 dehydrogenase / sirohydrochlorin ferrochelatase
VSGYPLVLDGAQLTATVVGGGTVATRKISSLIRAGARVRAVAREISAELQALSRACGGLDAHVGEYTEGDLEGAQLVIAATDDADLNARVAQDARARGCLVNVADAPERGNCLTPATHAVGDLLIAVSAGGVPAAASRIRDAIAARFDERYARAIEDLGALRRAMLSRGERSRWRDANQALIGADFTAAVENGELAARTARWR